jgi:lipopolysaccharide biosynthesis regulator YciM
MVNNSKANLVKLLELKLDLFENMGKILTEQKNHLDKKEIDRFCEKSDEVDNIIEKVKNADYDIARLESIDERVAGMVNSDDDEIRKIVNSILKISRKNHKLLDELTDKLNDSYQDLKDALGDTFETGKIRAYKTVTQPSPVYFDKTS